MGGKREQWLAGWSVLPTYYAGSGWPAEQQAAGGRQKEGRVPACLVVALIADSTAALVRDRCYKRHAKSG